jgi:hypothetical protein
MGEYYLLDYNPGTQQYTYPRRGGVQLSGTCIVHTAECAADNDGVDTSAEGCASMIANRADYGSYHRLVDSDSIIRMVPFEYEAWQDSETNNWAVGISAALRTTDWLVMPADRRERVYRNLAACAAEFVAYMASKGIDVPLRRITGAEARARVSGFCAHGDSGIARTDPGTAFDWALFFRYTAEALNGGINLASSGTTTQSEEDEMRDDQMLELKRFIQEDNENRHVATRAVVVAKELGYNDKVFIQGEIERRHVVTREVVKSVVNTLAAFTPGVDSSKLEEALTDAVTKAVADGLAAGIDVNLSINGKEAA